ncbi:MAG: type II toxin-antitoxin system HipA family toxin [Chitinophagales bacterium]|nr:type II toxin-antitoxin system HipA family toxin [Chitinophagales bacterium]
MKDLERMAVSLNFGDQTFEVGELVSKDQKIFFKYYPDFLDAGLPISPIKMPLSDEILVPDIQVFDSLFGVFNDSLPDGWGRLLIDRALFARKINPENITPLHRLSLVGNGGMGALTYHPANDQLTEELELIKLDLIAEETKKILAGEETKYIEELINLAGSSGGARPKVFVGYNAKNGKLLPYLKELPPNFEHWLIKFSSSSDPNDIAQIEYAYYKMAIDAGIEMSDCQLFEGQSGRVYFGTKRFDRLGNQRIHLHSAAGLMHDNFRLSNMDYGHLMDAAFQLEKHVGAYSKILRLAAFNIYAHNRDDHSKNFSFLMDARGNWKLAPAYDLTFSFSSHGYHSTTVVGEGKSPGKKQLLELAKIFGVKDVDEIINQVKEVVSRWNQYAEESGVGKYSKERIKEAITRRLAF